MVNSLFRLNSELHRSLVKVVAAHNLMRRILWREKYCRLLADFGKNPSFSKTKFVHWGIVVTSFSWSHS